MELSLCMIVKDEEAHLGACLESIRDAVDEIIVVDSQSTDGTAELAAQLGAEVIAIERKDFDHGGTRDMALRRTTGDVVVVMMQDGVPADTHYVERMLSAFDEPHVAAVSGRQIAREDAPRHEQLVREYRYPAERRIWDKGEINRMGVRAFMISDACSAYRRDAYLQVGGFDRPVMTNEDMLMAQKLLDAGYSIGYFGDAAVRHSHCLTLFEQYARNYAVGRMMKRYEARLCHAGVLGEGVGLAASVLGQLLREGKIMQCAAFGMDCAARLLGNQTGRLLEMIAQ
jgi:rhamnosyltransferase